MDKKGEIYYEWENRIYTENEWKDEWSGGNYPNLRKEGRVMHETKRERIANTKKYYDDVWTKIGAYSIKYPSSYTGSIRSFMELFKADMYGNVISNIASKDSLTSYDVDHIFPWSRGGRSVLSNFAAVQSMANRHVKRDKIIQTLDPNAMKCGLQVNQLLSIVNFVVDMDRQIMTSSNKSSSGGRSSMKTMRSYLDHVKAWLLSGPPKGSSWYRFQSDIKYSEDGRVLWNYFVTREIESLKVFDIRNENNLISTRTLEQNEKDDKSMVADDLKSSESKEDNSSIHREVTTNESHTTSITATVVFGKCKDGNDCKNCIKANGFCKLHLSQASEIVSNNSPIPSNPSESDVSSHSSKSNDSSGRSSEDSPNELDMKVKNKTSTTGSYGVCKNGNDCKNCIKVNGYCNRHKDQEKSQKT